MTLLEAVFVLLAGVGAGAINAVIGSGTLITFPVLLAVGYPPVTANVTNALGLVPGSATAAYAYRGDLRGHWRRVARYGVAAAAGATAGAVLLLSIPEEAFAVVVPVLIASALVLVVAQPRISAAVQARRGPGADPEGGPAVYAGVGATGVYGGYFGAGQGIMLFALLGSLLPDELRRVNAIRNILAGVNNATAAVVFCLVADVRPGPAALIAVGASAGGLLGARLGRLLSETQLRIVVVLVGLAAIAQLVL